MEWGGAVENGGSSGVWGWDLDPFCSSKRMALISLKDEQEKYLGEGGSCGCLGEV